MRYTRQFTAVAFFMMLLATSSVSGSQRVIFNSACVPAQLFPTELLLPTHFSNFTVVGYNSGEGPLVLQKMPNGSIDQQGNQGEEFAFLLKQWNELFSKIREEEKLVQNLFRDATNAQFKASQQLRTAEMNKKLTESDKLATLTEAYEKSVLNLKEAKLRQKEVKKLLDKARKINSKPSDITEKKLNKTRTDYNLLLARYSPERPPLPEPVPLQPKPQPEPTTATTTPTPSTETTTPKTSSQKTPKTSSQTTTPTTTATPTQSSPTVEPQKKQPPSTTPDSKPAVVETQMVEYDPSMIHKRPGQLKEKAYTSQPFECMFESDTIDQASGLIRRALQPSLLFTHTDPDLRVYFKDKELITCLGRLTKIGYFIYLTIEFQIASSHSQGNFGSLQNGSLLRFKLMNDEFVSLYNMKENEGRIDPYSGYTVFTGQYAIGKEEIKKLSASELDKMRVMWTTGYEDYDIYNLDFLINQLNCLKAKK